MELLPFVDILKVFNNPINEEQAWAVCYQCAHFLQRNPSQEFYQDVFDSGIHSIWLSRHGDVLLRKGPPDPNGSGKGPPLNSSSRHNQSSSSSSTTSTTTTSTTTTTTSSSARTTTTPHHKGKGHVLATETDAVQALGTAIFEALDYGIDQSEERQLSPELESIIVAMTNTAVDSSLDYDHEAASNGDDEGIEKDADVETRCVVHDVIRMCVRHLSSKQDASHHYKAVCRALATEAGELFTFLDKVAAGKEQLSQTEDEDARRLEELQRADWACLWVQVMRSLRQGVRLKKVEHVHLPPLEYELTPFEMILEDIRSRRYTLTKIMVNGDIPHKVKNDAHAVILNFIRSRPPLKKVDDRKLKPKPPSPPDPHELLLNEIRSRPKLRPVRDGRVVVEKSAGLGSKTPSEEEADSEAKAPTKRVIKPDFNLLLNNSFEESSDDEDRSSNNSPGTPEYRLHRQSPQQQQQQQQQKPQQHLQQQHPHLYPRSDSLSMTPPPQHNWQRAVTREALLREPNAQQQGRPSRLQRRHTITICEAPLDHQVALKELPVLQEEEEEQQASPVREIHASAAGGRNSGSSSSSSSSLYQVRPAVLPRSSHSDNDIQGHVTNVTSSMTINLRQATPNLVRRASFEHRRSLTSQSSMGLSAIPEQEDDGKGGGGGPVDPGGSKSLARAKSQEQCPPPNPSPPCKGRAKAGLAMVGMKSSGGPYHPNSHLRSQSAAHTTNTTTSTAAVATAAATNLPRASSFPTPYTSTASMQHAPPSTQSLSNPPHSSSSGFQRALQSQPAHPPPPSTASSASFSLPSSAYSANNASSSFPLAQRSLLPSTNERSPQLQRAASLDTGSPAYRKIPQGSGIQNGAMSAGDSGNFEGRISRWRMPVAAQARNHQGDHQPLAAPTSVTYSPAPSSNYSNLNCNINNSRRYPPAPGDASSPRRWAGSIPEDTRSSYSSNSFSEEGNSYSAPQPYNPQPYPTVGAGYYPVGLSEEECRHKRLSLDAGMSMYYEEALKQDDSAPESLPSSPAPGRVNPGVTRRTSLGLERGVAGRTGFRRIKSPEEEERVTRWRALQEDDRQARLRRQQSPRRGDEVVEGSQNQALYSPISSRVVGQRQEQQAQSRRSGVAALTPPSPDRQPAETNLTPESTDVLQQRMVHEEARFDRWRRLEEGTGSHPVLEYHLRTHSPSPRSSPNMNLTRQGYNAYSSGEPGLPPEASRPSHREFAAQSSPLDPQRVVSPQPQSLGPPLPAPPPLSASASSDPTASSVHDVLPLAKRWQNPVECLSLTLEEVTHIRSVLTKAELESLVSHSDLYQQVAKSKLCFTCKTTRFALFGEWGTKCKFCKRTVCSKCLRKMNVPADHFRNIPVYTLSPMPLTPEMQDFIQDFIKGAPAASVPATREHSPIRGDAPATSPSSLPPSVQSSSSSQSTPSPAAAVPSGSAGKPSFLSGPAKALQRSQSALVTGQKSKPGPLGSSSSSSSSSSAIKGPVMAICCDCKGMVMEIIRATRASLTLLSSSEGRASLSNAPLPSSSSSAAAAHLGPSSFSASSPSSSSSSTSPLSPSASLNHSARQYLASKSKMVSN